MLRVACRFWLHIGARGQEMKRFANGVLFTCAHFGSSAGPARMRTRMCGIAEGSRSSATRTRKRVSNIVRNDTVQNEQSVIQAALASGDDLVYGLSSVHLALEADRRSAHALFVQGNQGARKTSNQKLHALCISRAQKLQIPIHYADRGELNSLSQNRPHQGVVLQASALEYMHIDGIPDVNPRRTLLVLDEVQDPQNLGALIRSAYFLGAAGVYASQKNSARLSPVVSRASAGAAELVSVYGVGSLPRFLKSAREVGWRIIGADAGESATDLNNVDANASSSSSSSTMLVLGSEGNGLRHVVKECCTQLVRIEKGEHAHAVVDSLNVSVAGAIFLHHFLKG